MYPSNDGMPKPLVGASDLGDLDTLTTDGDVNERPFNVFIGHNLGHRVFTMSVPFRQFFKISDVANDREVGPVAQRPLDTNHAKNLAKYMLRGLVSAAKLRREIQGKEVIESFEGILEQLGTQPYFSLQPLVCNIRGVPYGGTGDGGIRGIRLQTNMGETAAFKVFLAERHTLWVIDGQHRRAAADMVMDFLTQVRQSGRSPAKSAVLFPNKGTEVSQEEMTVWNETYDATRSYSTLTVEVHLGLDIEQERQLFHDLNKLGKKVSTSMALEFDSSNPITQFIKSNLVADGLIRVNDREIKDWEIDKGDLPMKDIVAVCALAFLNKSNISGATPADVEPRERSVKQLWEQIAEIPGFGEEKSKQKTVAAQPVVMKALAKIVYDLLYSNRRPNNGDDLFASYIEKLSSIDFSHQNPIWRYYDLTAQEIDRYGLQDLADWLPDQDTTANRDIGSYQGGYMRFGAKHNDIYPILGDMIRYQLQLPSRHR